MTRGGHPTTRDGSTRSTGASREGVKKMAEWLYDIKRTGSLSGSDLENLLHEQGKNGWELVQVLTPSEFRNGTDYSLIFKREKPLMSQE